MSDIIRSSSSSSSSSPSPASSSSSILKSNASPPSSSNGPWSSTSESFSGQPVTCADIFHATLSGERDPPLIPRLRSDVSPRAYRTTAEVRSLPQYVAAEGGPNRRLERLRAMWEKLPDRTSTEHVESSDLAMSEDALAIATASSSTYTYTGSRLEEDSSPNSLLPSLRSSASTGSPSAASAISGPSEAYPSSPRYTLSPEHATRMRKTYLRELEGRCESRREAGEKVLDVALALKSGSDRKGKGKAVNWEDFVRYADEKEQELWNIFHNELDLDRNGHLDADEWASALRKAGIEVPPSALTEFMTFLTSSSHSHSITFPEFRDFLLLMPRAASTAEIYDYYQVMRQIDHDARGAARTTMEGDVSLSAEDRHVRPLSPSSLPHLPKAPNEAQSLENLPTSTSNPSLVHDPVAQPLVDHTAPDPGDHSNPHIHEHDHEHDRDDDDGHHMFGGTTAVKFLLAGGIAGVVSRTATAPFDRLKVFLITASPEELGVPRSQANMNFTDLAMKSVKEGAAKNGVSGAAQGAVVGGAKVAQKGSRAIVNAISSLYRGGGVRAFWVGNGVNSAKILPESALKFLSYETSKRFFAQHFDGVEDSRDISGVSRFISGGIGGITSQLVIYPVETLKTQMMSTKGGSRRDVMVSARQVWALGGVRAYYRGLLVGLVGVFPYSAIDMSTFEALTLAYGRSTGRSEPSVLAMLAFGSISGGSSGHPQKYDGMMDVVRLTYKREGWRGFYKGLAPSLAKVVPAVSISYVVYEKSKRALGVA